MEKLDKIWIWCIEYKRRQNMMCFRLEKKNLESEHRFSAFWNFIKKWLPMTSHSGLAWGSSDDRNDVRLNFYIFWTGHVTNTVLDPYERLELRHNFVYINFHFYVICPSGHWFKSQGVQKIELWFTSHISEMKSSRFQC